MGCQFQDFWFSNQIRARYKSVIKEGKQRALPSPFRGQGKQFPKEFSGLSQQHEAFEIFPEDDKQNWSK